MRGSQRPRAGGRSRALVHVLASPRNRNRTRTRTPHPAPPAGSQPGEGAPVDQRDDRRIRGPSVRDAAVAVANRAPLPPLPLQLPLPLPLPLPPPPPDRAWLRGTTRRAPTAGRQMSTRRGRNGPSARVSMRTSRMWSSASSATGTTTCSFCSLEVCWICCSGRGVRRGRDTGQARVPECACGGATAASPHRLPHPPPLPSPRWQICRIGSKQAPW